METCCDSEAKALRVLRERQAGVLRVVLVASLAMFAIEFGAGLWAHSTALLSDSLEMLSDAFVYAFSLYVLHRSAAWRASAALVKGVLMAAFGIGVLIEAGFRLRSGELPSAPAMATFATLALATNTLCFSLLYRHRSDDVNLRSTWLCTRNDLAANIAVLVAAGIVAQLGVSWPDRVVGIAIALLFLRTSATVIRAALSELPGRPWPGAPPPVQPAPQFTSATSRINKGFAPPLPRAKLSHEPPMLEPPQ